MDSPDVGGASPAGEAGAASGSGFKRLVPVGSPRPPPPHVAGAGADGADWTARAAAEPADAQSQGDDPSSGWLLAATPPPGEAAQQGDIDLAAYRNALYSNPQQGDALGNVAAAIGRAVNQGARWLGGAQPGALGPVYIPTGSRPVEPGPEEQLPAAASSVADDDFVHIPSGGLPVSGIGTPLGARQNSQNSLQSSVAAPRLPPPDWGPRAAPPLTAACLRAAAAAPPAGGRASFRWLSLDPRTAAETRYPQDVERALEDAFQKGRCNVVIRLGGMPFTVDFQQMTQESATGGLRRCWRDPAEEPRSETWCGAIDAAAWLRLRDRCFRGGCDPAARRAVWLRLLNIEHPADDAAARRRRRADLKEQYNAVCVAAAEARREAEEEAAGQGHPGSANASLLRSLRLLDKDVRRTDRDLGLFRDDQGEGLTALRRVLSAHCLLHSRLGYCQGMSDLCAVLYGVLRDEPATYAAFGELLRRGAADAFARPEVAGTDLLRVLRTVDPRLASTLEERDPGFIFAFRWIVVLFKREFPLPDVLRLWDSFLACRETQRYHLLLSAALLKELAPQLALGGGLSYEHLVRFAQGLGAGVAVQDVLHYAERMYDAADPAGPLLAALNVPLSSPVAYPG